MAFRTLDVFPNMELCGVGLNLTLANGRIGCAHKSRTSNCAKKPKTPSMRFVRPYSETPAVRGSLDLLTQVGTQCERAVIVQLLVTSPAHGIAHSLYLNLSSKFQSFPIYEVRKHQLCLPNLAR